MEEEEYSSVIFIWNFTFFLLNIQDGGGEDHVEEEEDDDGVHSSPEDHMKYIAGDKIKNNTNLFLSFFHFPLSLISPVPLLLL